jgi:hypothetical protein
VWGRRPYDKNACRACVPLGHACANPNPNPNQARDAEKAAASEKAAKAKVAEKAERAVTQPQP